ncbi:MAG: hypothetical protein ACO32I_01305 [Candidatus Limnocylindrus sp.]
MSDVQFMSSEALVPIGQPPYAVRSLAGTDYIEIPARAGLSETRAVFADGQRVTQYFIESDSLIYIRMRDVRDVRTIEVYSAGTADEVESSLKVEILPRSSLVSGIEQLRQRVVKLLLTTSGSSAFDDLGGGLQSVIGLNLSNTDLSVEIIQRIRQVELQLTRVDEVDPTRMLRSIDVLSITTTPPDGARVSVRVTNVAGETATTEV